MRVLLLLASVENSSALADWIIGTAAAWLPIREQIATAARSSRGLLRGRRLRRRRRSGAAPTGWRVAPPDDRLRAEPGTSRFPDVQLHIEVRPLCSRPGLTIVEK